MHGERGRHGRLDSAGTRTPLALAFGRKAPLWQVGKDSPRCREERHESMVAIIVILSTIP